MEKPQDEDNKPTKGLTSLVITSVFFQILYLLDSLYKTFMLRVTGKGKLRSSLYNLGLNNYWYVFFWEKHFS